jgi:osmotically inducible protein OsmC
MLGLRAMAVQRKADVVWENDLLNGSGRLRFASGGLPEAQVTWKARTEEPGAKTSPEELLAAAHASCFAMAFSATLARRGTPPMRLEVSAICTFDKVGGGWKVTTMDLSVKGQVPGIDQAKFEDAAKAGEATCPISNALRNNVQINLNARLQ